MKSVPLSACAAIALAASAPAFAQHGGHATPPPAATPPAAPPAPAEPPMIDHSAHGKPPAPPQGEPVDHSGHAMPDAQRQGVEPSMSGALGSYPMSREASGTAWQPDASHHGGLHAAAGDWTLMGHLTLNAVYDWQEGPRGDEMGFVSGMVMGMARRDLGRGTLQFRAMLSPDPFMGRRGYPLHLASGETADGITPLVDRQHPHDLFMEMSASYSLRLSNYASLFLYAGLPGEPAFGPPAFMHRMSILDSPEAPISHHWLDSTHITFGVVTAGLVLGDFKAEASRFNGREPDERRYDIETGPLDSTALRLSWNPTPNLSLQASWAHLVGSEQLEPDENSTRWSASAIYTRPIGAGGWWSTTLAWGRRSGEDAQYDAFVLESAIGLRAWTLFARAERTENNELVSAGGHHGPTFEVAKVSLGAIRDFRVGPNARLGIGALYSMNFVPAALEGLYAGDPDGAMVFIRLKIE
ncbi:MAG TPA: hypothetical protein VEX35_01400 [Allosphingosinicella sp.]|nr:hypothetical protein [Allosphingosinicella sp.]